MAPKIFITSDSSPSSPLLDLSSTFRDNIRSFLRDYAHLQDYTIRGHPVSLLFLASEATGVVFPLFTVQELISPSHPHPLCDFCRCLGWGHHYVSKLRYHFIIPSEDEWHQPLQQDCLNPTTNSHLLHALIHCNGFGHLLSLNTHAYLSASRIMHFWDRLCLSLHTRKVSLDDISRKKSMDLRLLHAVAYGRSWFGKWGYEFSHGSFGVRHDHYLRAILILRSIGIDKILEDFSGTRKQRVMKMIIDFYRNTSQTPLLTLSDLFQFMLVFGSKTPVARKTAMALLGMSLGDPVSDTNQGDDASTDFSPSCSSPDDDDNGNDSGTDTVTKPPRYDSFDTLAKEEGSRYPARRLKEAAQAVVKVIQGRTSILIRQELRDAVRNSIGDTGLIDFLLKHIDKVLIGDKIVERHTNPENRMLQFSLRTINPCALVRKPKKRRKQKPQATDAWKPDTPGLSVDEDILYLYENLLLDYPDSGLYRDASEVILNSKSFVKEWPLPSYLQEQNLLTVSCQVLPNHEELIQDFTRSLPPGELVVVPENATIRELKSAAEKALRDTYCIMETFEVLEIRNRDLEKLDESSVLKSEGNKTRTEFLVTGFGLDTGAEVRYEGGIDDWTVDCRCGARDDDGERMVACDACKVWYHTKCNSIEDDEAVPSVFLCNRCSGDGLRSKKRSVTVR